MTSEKLLLALALALIGAGFGYAYLTAPTWVTVAVGPAGSADERLMHAFSDQLREQRTNLRLKVVPVADVRNASQKLDRNEADLAVIRPDVAVPQTGLTLAVLRDAATIIIAPKSHGVTELGDLAGKTLGVAVGIDGDPAFVTGILRHFDLEPPTVTLLPLERADVLGALKAGRIDAVAIIAPAAGTVASDFVRSLARAYEGQVAILPVETADAMFQRSPILIMTSVPEGVWGGRPKQPEKEVRTVGVSYRLMARSDLDRGTVAALLENLFQMRSRLASVTRSANFMRAPEMDTSASATTAMLPNHPGAVDYFQREVRSLMDRYGDWIYLVAFFGSGIASGVVWLSQRLRRRRREVIDDVLDRLLAILADARAAEDDTKLDTLTAEVDELLRVAVSHARTGATGTRTTSAVMLALEGSRSAIEDRRRAIGHASAEPPRRGGGQPRLVTVS